jgi:tetratricopeptide (TPR) repeat protein
MELTLGEALKKGVEAHKSGQLQEAQRLYNSILKAQPKHPDANHNMGVLAVGVGKVQESLPFFKTASESNPRVGQFWLSYIDALIKLGRSSDAEAMFDQAKYNGANSDAFDKLGEQFTGKNLKVNKAELSEIGSVATRSIRPNILDTIKLDQALRLGHRASKAERAEEAQNIFRDILYKFPKNKKALLALQLSVAGSARAPQDPPSQDHQVIISLYTQGKFQQALSGASQMLNLFPNSPMLYNIAGASHAGLMQFDAAIESYKEAIKIEPNSPETYYNMAAALNDKGSFEEAIDSYKKALKLKSDYAEAYKNLGSLYHDQHQYNKARDCFDQLTDRYSVAKALECTYFLENYAEFDDRLQTIAKTNPANIRVAAVSAFAAHQSKKKDLYPFCENPNEFINVSNIKDHVPDSDTFINTLLEEMNKKNAAWEPKKNTTISGFHTSGNLLASPSETLSVLEGIILKELELYYSKFKTFNNVFITKWPKKNNINAWYIRMLKNGHQKAHIHPAGWVSGVFYLKTVESPIEHEGAIEFGLHGYGYPVKNEEYPRQIYQPNNGDLILFPSSLFHKTIPVIKDVERCVIAFDFLS